MRNLLLLIVVIGTLSFTLSKQVTRNVEKASIASGKAAPQFALKDHNDQLVQLNDLQGKYVYINLWTTWSKPSKDELPHLQELIEIYSDAVNFVNLSIDYQRDAKEWKSFINEQKLKGIHLLADHDWQSQLIEDYSIVKIPRAILIDPDGNIVDAYAPKPSQKAQITKLLSACTEK